MAAEIDTSTYECPCGKGQIEITYTDPNHGYGGASYSHVLDCAECSAVWDSRQSYQHCILSLKADLVVVNEARARGAAPDEIKRLKDAVTRKVYGGFSI